MNGERCGDTGPRAANEQTAFRPKSRYGGGQGGRHLPGGQLPRLTDFLPVQVISPLSDPGGMLV